MMEKERKSSLNNFYFQCFFAVYLNVFKKRSGIIFFSLVAGFKLHVLYSCRNHTNAHSAQNKSKQYKQYHHWFQTNEWTRKRIGKTKNKTWRLKSNGIKSMLQLYFTLFILYIVYGQRIAHLLFLHRFFLLLLLCCCVVFLFSFLRNHFVSFFCFNFIFSFLQFALCVTLVASTSIDNEQCVHIFFVHSELFVSLDDWR